MALSDVRRILAASALTTVVVLPIACARADAVTDWNAIALDATARPPNSILQSRTLAIVHGAIYDAVRAVERNGRAYAVDVEAPAGTSVEAAVVAALRDTGRRRVSPITSCRTLSKSKKNGRPWTKPATTSRPVTG